MSVSPSTLTKNPKKSLQPLVPLSASDPSFQPLLPPKSIKHSSSSTLINEAQWGMDVVLNYLTKCKNFRIGQPLRIITKSSYYKRNSTPRVYIGTIYRKEEKKTQGNSIRNLEWPFTTVFTKHFHKSSHTLYS